MSLRARLLVAIAYVLVLAIVALEVPLGLSIRDRIDAEVRSQARAQADVVAASAALDAGAARPGRLRSLATVAARTTRGRVVIVDPHGIVLADSGGRTWIGASYASRPEIARALRGVRAQDVRRSATLNTDLLATAAPIARGRRIVGAVRITQSIQAVQRAVHRAWAGLALAALAVLGVGLGVGIAVAGGLAAPLRRLDAAVRRLARGDLDARSPVQGSTEQRALARAFNDMAARVDRALVAQREFVADASHQLRSPLTALRLRIEAAARSWSDTPAHAELEAALAEVDRLALLVAELLELSRAGERDAPGALVSSTERLAAAAGRWAPAAELRDQRVIAVPGSSALVWCAPADIDRVIDALVENALRYSPANTTVRLASTARGFTVADEGPGLAQGEEEAVFERFHRGAAAQAGPSGTGLGLPIARELARRWGGEVTLANRAAGGVVAEVVLPAAGGHASAGRSERVGVAA